MFNDYSKIRKWEIAGFIWIVLIGSLLHFTYDWSGKSSIVALFSPVNESVWEHLKMGYFTVLFFILIEYWFINRYTNSFFLAKTIGIISMNLFIVIVFYSYTAITKSPNLIIDIGSFVVGAMICQFISFKIMKIKVSSTLNNIGLISFILMGCIFVVFTFYTPKLPIFKDSNTGEYGVVLKEVFHNLFISYETPLSII